jgi:hypothetical protein
MTDARIEVHTSSDDDEVITDELVEEIDAAIELGLEAVVESIREKFKTRVPGLDVQYR